MKDSTKKKLDDLFCRFSQLTVIQDSIYNATAIMIESYKNGGKLLVCGNGGSAADALHIVGELMKGFVLNRDLPKELKQKISTCSEYGEYITGNLQAALPAIALVGSVSLETAYSNDKCPDLCFAQQVLGLGAEGDVFLGISTSGNSQNVIYAAEVAKALGLKVIVLSGRTGGKLKDICDCLVNVPEDETYKIQELHLPVYHAVCLALENEFFGE